MKLKIKMADVVLDVGIAAQRFPKYTTILMNLANQIAQGTRPKVVGQLSEMIQVFPGETYREWTQWYLLQNPDGISKATARIVAALEKLRQALQEIDEDLVRCWVEDLILAKTYVGLRFQESVLRRIAESKGASYRLATPAEEARGIDGFIGDLAVSIKPLSYKTMPMLQESICAAIVYYEKEKGGIRVEFDF